MLASLIVISSVFQFALAAWLPMLRRIITPVVSGTALMLIAVTVMSIAVDSEGGARGRAAGRWSIRRCGDVGDRHGAGDARFRGLAAVGPAHRNRFWLCGRRLLWTVRRSTSGRSALVQHAGYRGMAGAGPDTGRGVLGASAGIRYCGPRGRHQDQQRRRRHSTGLAAQAAGDRLSPGPGRDQHQRTHPAVRNCRDAAHCGLFGFQRVAHQPHRGGSAQRWVRHGVILLALAFLPKVTAILLTVPSPVMGGYLLMIMGLLFVGGMKTVVQDGLDHRKALVVGVALSIGVGLENQNILADMLGRTWGASLGNGMTVGVLAAILMTSFIELTSPRRRRLDSGVGRLRSAQDRRIPPTTCVQDRYANDASTELLRAAGEETLSSLLQSGGSYAAGNAPRLIIVARPDGGAVELEFLAVFDEDNLEDRLAYLSEQAEIPEEHEISFRLLRTMHLPCATGNITA